MQNVFFNNEILDAEKRIISTLKISSLALMENAGANSASYISDFISAKKEFSVIVIAGKGSNAGDGFVITRHLLAKNIPVKLIHLYKKSEFKSDALANFTILENLNDKNLNIIFCKDVKQLKKGISNGNKVIIDAIFGAGFKGRPDKYISDVIEIINSAKNSFVFSVDVPSGLYDFNDKSISVKADITLTMGARKFSTLFYNGREKSGKVEVMSIGISDELFTKNNLRKIFFIEQKDIKKILPVRNINSNKYQNGKVFILTGSKGLTGASYLCSKSAMRTGIGAVIAGVPESLNEILEIKLTEVMTIPLSETNEATFSLKSYDAVKAKLTWADAVLIGPGISKNEETLVLVRKIVDENDLPFVIDADAISAFRGNLNLLKNKNIILTPHLGEFANLTGQNINEVKNNFYELSRKFAEEYNVILVLKNSPSIITNGDVFYINSTGKENLATAGTGDVLSGIIAGLFSQIKTPVESAMAGCFIHGKCGDSLYNLMPDSMLASDLIEEIPVVKNQILID